MAAGEATSEVSYFGSLVSDAQQIEDCTGTEE